jgi:CHAD domain-containing protein
LLRHLENRRVSCDDKLRRALDDDFERTTERVERALLHFEASVLDDDPSYAVVAGELVTRHAAALVEAMNTLSNSGDRLEVHTARIAAKRLRYLLEVLGPDRFDSTRAIDALKQLQNDLGEVHDAQVFGSEIATLIASLLAERVLPSVRGKSNARGGDRGRSDPIPGLKMLARRLRRIEQATFKRIERSWDDETVRQLAPVGDSSIA